MTESPIGSVRAITVKHDVHVILFPVPGIVYDCQRRREQNQKEYSGAWIVDPDGDAKDGKDPYLAYCEMVRDPPLGITVSIHGYVVIVYCDYMVLWLHSA